MLQFEYAALYSAAMGSREVAMVVVQNTNPPAIVSLNTFFDGMVEPAFSIVVDI
jgi:hypothetical protein